MGKMEKYLILTPDQDPNLLLIVLIFMEDLGSVENLNKLFVILLLNLKMLIISMELDSPKILLQETPLESWYSHGKNAQEIGQHLLKQILRRFNMMECLPILLLWLMSRHPKMNVLPSILMFVTKETPNLPFVKISKTLN